MFPNYLGLREPHNLTRLHGLDIDCVRGKGLLVESGTRPRLCIQSHPAIASYLRNLSRGACILVANAKTSMRKLARTLLLGILLCLILLTGGLWWFPRKDCTALPERLYHRIVLREQDFIGHNVRFKVRGQGARLPPNGRLSGFTTMRASDCVEVIMESEDEGSPLQAKDEMEKRIRGASRVVERGPEVDLPGRPDGERAVLLLGTDARAEIVVWFEGNRRLGIIESASLAHALAYEKLIEKGYRLDADGYVIAMGQ